jgi:rubrerythrin
MPKYSVENIIKHAIEIEEAGQKFYALLADRLNDAKLKKINIFSHGAPGNRPL